MTSKALPMGAEASRLSRALPAWSTVATVTLTYVIGRLAASVAAGAVTGSMPVNPADDRVGEGGRS